MQDNDLTNKLKKLDIPMPSEEAKARAMQAAMQSFEKNRKGMQETIRPISTTTQWEQLKRRITMQKAYVFAGSFAAIAVVLAITTTHYSAIMKDVMVAPRTESTIAAATAPQDVLAPNPAKELAFKNAKKESDVGAADSVVNNNAPGMPESSVVSEPPMHMSATTPVGGKPVPYRDPVVANSEVRREVAPVASLAAPGLAQGQARDMMAKKARIAAAPAPGIAVQYDSIMPYPQPTPYYAGGDKFESHASNPVKQVAQEPVSTFSIDVDTASYSFVRRIINQGQLPQPDMVRVEEMINYFDYNYPLPESKSEPFKPTVAVVPTPWNKNTKLVHIGIKGYDVATKPHANLVFLIDVSGSMNQPDKLPLVKSSLKMLLDQLNPDDTIGIVTYAGYAGTALTPTKISDKQKIISVIDQLGAGGGTAGGEGIKNAYALAESNFDKEGVNRVILATDGDFNVGITDPNQLQKFIEEKRDSGVTLSILGFGQGNYNDSLMQKLAEHGNGNAAYIDNLSEARKVLVQEAGSTLFTIAKDVKIQVEFNPAMVSQYRLIGYESRMLNREDFNNDKVDAGDVGAGHAVTAIYEITPVGSAGPVDDLRYGAAPVKQEKTASNFAGEYGFLKMRYKLPSGTESKLITTPIDNSVLYGECPIFTKCKASAIPEDVRFAIAVAAFGEYLRGDSQLNGYSIDEIAQLADGARGKDTFGYRAEFVQLINTAKSLGTAPQSQPMPMPID